MKWLLAMMLLVWPVVSQADEWKTRDTVVEATYLALHVVDWGQTLSIADQPDKYHEHNKALGKHPSRGEVNTYFIATGLIHPVVSYLLPRPYREVWQAVTIIVEVGCVVNNYSLGVGWRF